MRLLIQILALLICQSAYALSIVHMSPGEQKTVTTSTIPGYSEEMPERFESSIGNSDYYWVVIAVDDIDFDKTYLVTFTWPLSDSSRTFIFSSPKFSPDDRISLNKGSMDKSIASLWNCSASSALVNISFETAVSNPPHQFLIAIATPEPGLQTTVKIEESMYTDEQITGPIIPPTCTGNHALYIGSAIELVIEGDFLDQTDNVENESSNSTGDSNVEFVGLGPSDAPIIWIETEEEDSFNVQETGANWDSHQDNSYDDYSGYGYWYLSRAGDELIYFVNIEEDGDYYIWIRDFSDTSHPFGQRAINLYIDDQFIGKFAENNSGNGFNWHHLATVYLTSGTHEFIISKAENTSAAALVDVYLLTQDKDFIASGKMIYHGNADNNEENVTDQNNDYNSNSATNTNQNVQKQMIASLNPICSKIQIDTNRLVDLFVTFDIDQDDIGILMDYYVVFEYDGAWLSMASDGQIVSGIVPFIQRTEDLNELNLLNIRNVDFSGFKGHSLTMYSGYTLLNSFPLVTKYDCIEFEFK